MGKSHQCEFCYAPHRTSSCPQRPQGWVSPPELVKGKGKGKEKSKNNNKGKKGGKGAQRQW